MLAGALTVAAIGPWVFGRPIRIWLLAVAAVVFFSALAWPKGLAPIHRALRAAAKIIGFVVQQVALLVLYFVVLTPMGLLARLIGRNVMGARFRPNVESYWIDRPAPGPLSDELQRPH